MIRSHFVGTSGSTAFDSQSDRFIILSKAGFCCCNRNLEKWNFEPLIGNSFKIETFMSNWDFEWFCVSNSPKKPFQNFEFHKILRFETQNSSSNSTDQNLIFSNGCSRKVRPYFKAYRESVSYLGEWYVCGYGVWYVLRWHTKVSAWSY